MKSNYRHKINTILATAALAIMPALFLSCKTDKTPFEIFYDIMIENEPYSRTETGEGGYVYSLENGVLTITLGTGKEIWRSEEDWWVDDFRLGDVDGNGVQDFVFTLWKSYRFGDAKPARMDNDDDTVSNHLFVYTVMPGYVKSVWCSSDLPRPIYSFELDPSGEITPVSSGMILRTDEGEYRDDFSRTELTAYKYSWEGWGFVPLESFVYTATISFTGDLMVHGQQLDDALSKGGGVYNFDHCFEPIKGYLQNSDYTIGNLETTFPGNPSLYSDFPYFGAPDAFGVALKNAGFDMVTTANNHSLDKGVDGLIRTLDTLDSIGIEHTGTYRTQQERDTVFTKDIGGITFAFISYTYGTNGQIVPEESEYIINVMDEQNSYSKIFADIRAAKELNPDFIIVLPHMGDEYSFTPRQEYVDLVNKMFMTGADVVVATHPHVIQPVKFIEITDEYGEKRRCFVAYSLGNFISTQRDSFTDSGIILNLTFEKAEGQKGFIKSADYIPTWVQIAGFIGGYDIKVLPVNDILAVLSNGDNYELRPADIERVKEVFVKISEIISGRKIKVEDVLNELQENGII